jgi:hypothetical protein
MIGCCCNTEPLIDFCLARNADLVAYQIAPVIDKHSPAALAGSKIKSEKAKAPTTVMTAFFKLPATDVIKGSLIRVQTKVEWLILRPNALARNKTSCNRGKKKRKNNGF